MRGVRAVVRGHQCCTHEEVWDEEAAAAILEEQVGEPPDVSSANGAADGAYPVQETKPWQIFSGYMQVEEGPSERAKSSRVMLYREGTTSGSPTARGQQSVMTRRRHHHRLWQTLRPLNRSHRRWRGVPVGCCR